MTDDPRAGTTIEWPPYLQTLLTAQAMRVVNRSRLDDPEILVRYWENNISNTGLEQSVIQSLLREQARARLMLSMIDQAIEQSQKITEDRGTGHLWRG